MSRTYVIADIHGRLDLLELALSEIESRTPGTVIFTGDFIDRGPESKGVVDRVMAGPTDPAWRWSVVRGNHEDMALHCADGTDLHWWIQNGGAQTLQSYGGPIPVEHLNWFASLPRITWDKYRVYVHAGVDATVPLEQQDEHTTQWKRYPKGWASGHGERHVVHGHTPQPDGPELFEGRTNLDVGSFFTSRLAIGVFDNDKPGGPVEVIGVSA